MESSIPQNAEERRVKVQARIDELDKNDPTNLKRRRILVQVLEKVSRPLVS